MTKTLDDVLEKVGRLAPNRQDEVARLLDRLVDLEPSIARRLTAEDWSELDRRLSAPARYASDERVEAFFRKALE